nr:MAG TPA: hypothetical protein [Caudoviricetes sp.]
MLPALVDINYLRPTNPSPMDLPDPSENLIRTTRSVKLKT